MGATSSSGPPAAFASFRLLPGCLPLLLLLQLLLRFQASGGFLIPAPANAAAVRRRQPPPTSLSTLPAAAAAATTTSGTTPANSSSDDDGSAWAAWQAARRALQTPPGASPAAPRHPVLSEFQEFVERRRLDARKVVIDLRPGAEFCRRHLKGSTSIPIEELEARLLELPPPFAQPVSIVGSRQDLCTASDLLTRKGWQIDSRIGPDLRVEANDAGDDAARAWPTEAGSASLQVWRANDFLEFCTEHFLLPAAVSAHGAVAPAPVGEGSVLDLGCGSGRDAVYLAQHLPPGAPVVGVDNHSYALERGARLAEQWLDGGGGGGGGGCGGGAKRDHGAMRRPRAVGASSGPGVGDDDEIISRGGVGRSEAGGSEVVARRRKCRWLLADLRKEGSLDGMRASVVHGHRFKCEQLLPLLRDDVLLPGGYFIWSTFLDTGKENSVPPWRPSRMMRPGELAGVFSGSGFEILVDEQGELPTRGSVVPANFFACRKMSSVP